MTDEWPNFVVPSLFQVWRDCTLIVLGAFAIWLLVFACSNYRRR